uniref:Uncharacterized protein n=1 Tax=Sphaerodactylus townsendi TaxID=933632 RepID=A0ACB8FHC8_9SAUR
MPILLDLVIIRVPRFKIPVGQRRTSHRAEEAAALVVAIVGHVEAYKASAARPPLDPSRPAHKPARLTGVKLRAEGELMPPRIKTGCPDPAHHLPLPGRPAIHPWQRGDHSSPLSRQRPFTAPALEQRCCHPRVLPHHARLSASAVRAGPPPACFLKACTQASRPSSSSRRQPQPGNRRQLGGHCCQLTGCPPARRRRAATVRASVKADALRFLPPAPAAPSVQLSRKVSRSRRRLEGRHRSASRSWTAAASEAAQQEGNPGKRLGVDGRSWRRRLAEEVRGNAAAAAANCSSGGLSAGRKQAAGGPTRCDEAA